MRRGLRTLFIAVTWVVGVLVVSAGLGWLLWGGLSDQGFSGTGDYSASVDYKYAGGIPGFEGRDWNKTTLEFSSDGTVRIKNLPVETNSLTRSSSCLTPTGDVYSGDGRWESFKNGKIEVKVGQNIVPLYASKASDGSPNWNLLSISWCSGKGRIWLA